MKWALFKSRRRLRMLPLLSLVALLTVAGALSGCSERDTAVIGHSGGPLLAAAYVAEGSPEFGDRFELSRLGTPADVGYALLSGDLDAGFIDPARYEAIKILPGFETLNVVGKITYPFGATLVVREGLNLRLSDLEGKKVGISQPECVLWDTVKADAERLGVDAGSFDLQAMHFDAMIPALEAGIVDAVVLRGGLAAVAIKEGHTILYQNWEVEETGNDPSVGDGCCPPATDQVESILLARRDNTDALRVLPELLESHQLASQADLRSAVARATGIPTATLEGLPVGRFEVADRGLVEELLGYDDREGEDEN